jgi:hypothetical protein
MRVDLENFQLHAYVGLDELGSGEIGIKQAAVPAGIIPIVAVSEDKLRQAYIVEQMRGQADQYGTEIHLARFVYVESRLILP